MEKTRKQLEKEFMSFPELEKQKKDWTNESGYSDVFEDMIHKSMYNINTFQCCDGELYLRGTDEYGKDFQVCFDAYNFLEWIDQEQIKYIKNQVIKHIKNK